MTLWGHEGTILLILGYWMLQSSLLHKLKLFDQIVLCGIFEEEIKVLTLFSR